jgi:hypothetical protein
MGRGRGSVCEENGDTEDAESESESESDDGLEPYDMTDDEESETEAAREPGGGGIYYVL